MNKLKITLFTTILLSGLVALSMGQTPPPQKANPEAVTADAPKPLTQEQRQRLSEAQTEFKLAKANFDAAEAKLNAAQTYIDGLVLQFALQLKVDTEKYDAQLRVLDEKAGVIGFLPKPPKEAPKEQPRPAKQ